MKAGRELDALIAEKVFGFQIEATIYGKREYYYIPPTKGYIRIPYYSSDMAAAWQVVEKLKHSKSWGITSLSRDMTGTWQACLGFNTTSHADTAPLAICLAALKAMEER